MGNKTNTDRLEETPTYYVEEKPTKLETDKLINSSECVELDLTELEEYIKTIEKRENNV